MSKTPESQKKASAEYAKRIKALGFIRKQIWIKPEWETLIQDLLNELKNYKG